MGRKNIGAERREQIVDAFERCILRYGLEGSTVDAIAREAGLSRTLVYHHGGKWEDLLQLLADRILLRSRESMAGVLGALPIEGRLGALIDVYTRWGAPTTTEQVLYTLMLSGRAGHPLLSAACDSVMHEWIDLLAGELFTDGHGTDMNQCREASYAITSLFIGYEAFRNSLAFRQRVTTLRAAAQTLIDALPVREVA